MRVSTLILDVLYKLRKPEYWTKDSAEDLQLYADHPYRTLWAAIREVAGPDMNARREMLKEIRVSITHVDPDYNARHYQGKPDSECVREWSIDPQLSHETLMMVLADAELRNYHNIVEYKYEREGK